MTAWIHPSFIPAREVSVAVVIVAFVSFAISVLIAIGSIYDEEKKVYMLTLAVLAGSMF